MFLGKMHNIMKYNRQYFVRLCCRSPHGERGLKFWDIGKTMISDVMSFSAWRTWIEIVVGMFFPLSYLVVLRMENVD